MSKDQGGLRVESLGIGALGVGSKYCLDGWSLSG